MTHDLEQLFPLIAHTAGSYLVLPLHTVDYETDFSALKLIEMQLRNCLKVKTFDYVIHIVVEGPDAGSYPYDTTVDDWAKLKNRRLTVSNVWNREMKTLAVNALGNCLKKLLSFIFDTVNRGAPVPPSRAAKERHSWATCQFVRSQLTRAI